jgi:DNA-binding CsgD family transcriptional regulator
VKKLRAFSKAIPHTKKSITNIHNGPFNSFVFCDKATGIAQFGAASSAHPDSTVERVAGLLAMQCLVRGHEPSDFAILVPAEKTLADRLTSRAKELLEEGRAVASPTCLSPRQREILHSVICNRANKEIADRLNITVRTVKFHISTLLSKFGVDNRTDLARRAAGVMRSNVGDGARVPFETHEPGVSRHRELGPIPVSSTDIELANKASNLRFPSRSLTA